MVHHGGDGRGDDRNHGRDNRDDDRGDHNHRGRGLHVHVHDRVHARVHVRVHGHGDRSGVPVALDHRTHLQLGLVCGLVVDLENQCEMVADWSRPMDDQSSVAGA